jgi:hypothetical protein
MRAARCRCVPAVYHVTGVCLLFIMSSLQNVQAVTSRRARLHHTRHKPSSVLIMHPQHTVCTPSIGCCIWRTCTGCSPRQIPPAGPHSTRVCTQYRLLPYTECGCCKLASSFNHTQIWFSDTHTPAQGLPAASTTSRASAGSHKQTCQAAHHMTQHALYPEDASQTL